MQTRLADWIRDTPAGIEADAILRKCVHCGFCLATCPTYDLLGDELDSPRGRIYLMKQMLEGAAVSQRTQLHLDRCLTCRACETTCPSGVEYGRLVDIPGSACCGAVTFHLNDQQGALPYARANIDAWWPFVEAGAEAIVITASGCGTMVKDYGHLLQHDARYAAKAARIAELAKDISEVISAERAALMPKLGKLPRPHKVAFQSPCSLQHGLKLSGVVESLLREAGYVLTPVPDAHLCCGSAGTYSILQPELSRRLLHRKVRALEGGFPDEIATANIGCLAHLGTAAAVPIRHWIELIDERLEDPQPSRA